ncbi:MAG: DUF2090 domain-containing protein [Candidatus Micrarchaeota archaeon]
MLNNADWTNKQIVILAFDHRGSFTKNLFGISGRGPTAEESKKVSDYKTVIYEGFKKALTNGVSKDVAGILVDEQFGKEIVHDAKKNGFRFAMPVEKSGQDEFDFEYGQDYQKHIKEFDPTFCKILVRLNPEGDRAVNERQMKRLRELGEFLKSINKPYLFELLVPATPEQLQSVGNDKKKYDFELRPKLMAWAVAMVQAAGIEPDIWKLEGVDRAEDAKRIVGQVQSAGRTAGVVTLGRGEDAEKVTEWLKIGAKINGVIGFAIGRTIFWDALAGLRDGKYDRQKAIEIIADNYQRFVKLWVGTR